MPRSFYWYADLIIGFGLPLAVWLAFRGKGKVGLPDQERESSEDRGLMEALQKLFWIGTAIGMTWELPIFLSASLGSRPILGFIEPPPVHPYILMVSHALWDGGLFLAGVLLVRRFFGPAAFAFFRWRELALFLGWGQLSAFLVEFSSITSGAWVYAAEHPWNWTYATFGGHPLPLLPQVLWAVAPVGYYLVVLWMIRRERRARDRE